MAQLLIEAGNPHDFDAEELEALAASIGARIDIPVAVRTRRERGYGVTEGEVLRLIVDVLELAATAGAAHQAFRLAVEWMRARWRKDRENAPGVEPRPRSVTLYGPGGEPLKSVRIAAPEGEPQDI